MPTVYNGHLQGPVTLTPNAERSAVELSLPVFTTKSVVTGDRTPISRMRGERGSISGQLALIKAISKARQGTKVVFRTNLRSFQLNK